MTPDFAKLRRLAEAATPGPWKTGDGAFRRNAILAQGSVDTCPGAAVWSTIFHADLIEAQDRDGRTWYAAGSSEANAAFIAAARTAVPQLIAEIERLEHDLARLEVNAGARLNERDAAIERLRERLFALSEGGCHDAIGDEYGNFPCPYKGEAERLRGERKAGMMRAAEIVKLLWRKEWSYPNRGRERNSRFYEPFIDQACALIQAEANGERKS